MPFYMCLMLQLRKAEQATWCTKLRINDDDHYSFDAFHVQQGWNKDALNPSITAGNTRMSIRYSVSKSHVVSFSGAPTYLHSIMDVCLPRNWPDRIPWTLHCRGSSCVRALSFTALSFHYPGMIASGLILIYRPLKRAEHRSRPFRGGKHPLEADSPAVATRDRGFSRSRCADRIERLLEISSCWMGE